MREIFETTIERLLADHVAPDDIAQAEGGAWPTALWAAIEETGLGLATASEASGGGEATWGEAFVIVRAAGRHGAPVPLPETLLANWLLSQAGLEALAGPASVGIGEGLTLDGGAVRGRLESVPFGRNVAHVVTVASGQVLLLAVKDAEIEAGLNTAREPRDALTFSGAAPLAAAPLPQGLDGEAVLLGGAMLRTAQIAGALQRALQLSTGYANERTQFGRPIGKFQAIQHNIALLSEHGSLATGAAETAFAADGLSHFQIAIAKSAASEAAGAGASLAHGVHGAIGFTYEHSLHFATRRLWAWRSEFGSQTFWAGRLGRAACKAGSRGLWPAITRGDFQAA